MYERKYGAEGYLGVINRDWEDVNVSSYLIQKLKDFLKGGAWKWYFG